MIPLPTRRHLAVLGLVGAVLASGPAAATPAPTAAPRAEAPTCRTPVGRHEPPCNPHVAESGWGGSHRNSYASGSSPYPAPHRGDAVTRDRVALPGSPSATPISVAFSSPYRDGRRVAWMSTVTPSAIHKVDTRTGDVIDSVLPVPTSQSSFSISGAYNLLDRDDHLFVGLADAIEVYGDAQVGRRTSPIARLARLRLPARALCGSDDRLVGITMTYDGHVAFATERGVVGVVPRRLGRFDREHLRTLNLNAGRCDQPDGRVQVVSNSISTDEGGGIYVVSSKRMNRVQWNGKRLSLRWSAGYNVGPPPSGVRLGAGSGSTPDVMGTSADRDRFVVITDGGPLMNLVLMWRDEIPADWKPVAPGKSRRIACEVPVTFGDPSATRTISEQSVLTSGYSSVIVNNSLRDESVLDLVPARIRPLVAAELGGDPRQAPHGMERIDWHPRTRTCSVTWVNETVSIPNAIPTLSTESGLIYGQGQRRGVWGLEGVSLRTGRVVLHEVSGPTPAGNSFYAATEVGPDGDVWQGTSGGIDVYRGPDRPGPRLR
ncbi:hypothetical protein [Nocardioides rubriscoriae]|uniref:hypothetical protein n=1 Tax=Nocardioides rubriscoriae TaxID=642762 RepID=UPI0011DFF2E5|nr:hypothetical protein [Nocardioides rubriscoriae]